MYVLFSYQIHLVFKKCQEAKRILHLFYNVYRNIIETSPQVNTAEICTLEENLIDCEPLSTPFLLFYRLSELLPTWCLSYTAEATCLDEAG